MAHLQEINKYQVKSYQQYLIGLTIMIICLHFFFITNQLNHSLIFAIDSLLCVSHYSVRLLWAKTFLITTFFQLKLTGYLSLFLMHSDTKIQLYLLKMTTFPIDPHCKDCSLQATLPNLGYFYNRGLWENSMSCRIQLEVQHLSTCKTMTHIMYVAA